MAERTVTVNEPELKSIIAALYAALLDIPTRKYSVKEDRCTGHGTRRRPVPVETTTWHISGCDDPPAPPAADEEAGP